MRSRLAVELIVERLTFNQLFSVSEPKRVVRSLTVRGPPLEIDAYKNSMYYGFNFKAHPSTTGLRHRGYVKFHKPRNAVALGDVPCEVDCDCPDYRYRWAWTNKQRGSGRVGAQSLNQAHNRAPRITNPEGRSGLCKHILAVKDYIEGQTSDRDFIGNEPEGDMASMLNKLVKRSQKIWINYDGTVAKAKEREKQLKQARAARNRGDLPPPDDEEGDEGDDGGTPPPSGNMPPLPPVPSAEPESEEGGESQDPTITLRDLLRERPAIPPLPPRPPRVESVDISTEFTMKREFEKAISIIEDMEDDIGPSGFENSVTGSCPEEEKSPGEQVIDLLTDISQSLQTLASVEPGLEPEGAAPEEEAPPAAPAASELPSDDELDLEGPEEDEEDVDKLSGV